MFSYYIQSAHALLNHHATTEVLRATESIDQGDTRCLVLIAIAHESDVHEARDVLLKAQPLIPSIADETKRSFARCASAMVWAKCHHYRYALRVSESCRAFDKIHVHQAILDHYWARQDGD